MRQPKNASTVNIFYNNFIFYVINNFPTYTKQKPLILQCMPRSSRQRLTIISVGVFSNGAWVHLTCPFLVQSTDLHRIKECRLNLLLKVLTKLNCKNRCLILMHIEIYWQYWCEDLQVCVIYISIKVTYIKICYRWRHQCHMYTFDHSKIWKTFSRSVKITTLYVLHPA